MNPVEATPPGSVSTNFSVSEWRAPGWPFRLCYRPETLDDIRAAAVEGANRFGVRGVEIGGLLFGKINTGPAGAVEIHAARPWPCEHAFGPSFRLSQSDLRRAQELYTQWLHERDLLGLAPVGLYLSRTRDRVGLTEEDISLFNSYCPRPWQVLLLLRPVRRMPTRATILYRNFTGQLVTTGETSERELEPLERRDPAVPRHRLGPELVRAEPEDHGPDEPTHLSPGPPAGAATPVAVIEEQPQAGIPATVEPPSFGIDLSAQRSRSGTWIAAALLILLSGLGVFAYRETWLPLLVRQDPPAPISLRALDHGGQLLIDWVRSAPAIRDAASAILVIQDGKTERSVQLDSRQLRAGSLTYSRRSGDVTITLRVTSRSGEVTEEITRFLGSPVATEQSITQQESETNAVAAGSRRLDRLLDQGRPRARPQRLRQTVNTRPSRN